MKTNIFLDTVHYKNIIDHDNYLIIDDSISDNNEDSDNQTSSLAYQEQKTKLQEPNMFKVLLHNDDFTPMNFVVMILEMYFGMNEAQATQTMLDVHRKGVGLCGIYTKEIAEAKTSLVRERAKMHQFPLKCTLEEDSDSYKLSH